MTLIVIAAIAFAVAAVFPYLIYPRTLDHFASRPIHRVSGAPLPSATLLFCAYNEAASAPAKLDNLRAIQRQWPALRFACFVDKSSDDTLAILSSAPDLLRVTAASARCGKATGMARLVADCDTDILIFTDANVMVDPDSVATLLGYFTDPTIGGVCGTLHYTNADASGAAAASSAYWRFEERLKRSESRSGSTMGADGSIFATRRALYPTVPAHLLDDMIVSMSVIFAGYRLVSAPDVHAYEAAVTDTAGEFRRRRRIACRAWLTHAYLRPRLRHMRAIDRYKYVGHKLMRWASVWNGLVAIDLTLIALTRATGPVLWPMLTIAALALLASRGRAAALVIEAGGQFVALALGMIDAWLGRRYQMWDTPAQRAPVAVGPKEKP